MFGSQPMSHFHIQLKAKLKCYHHCASKTRALQLHIFWRVLLRWITREVISQWTEMLLLFLLSFLPVLVYWSCWNFFSPYFFHRGLEMMIYNTSQKFRHILSFKWMGSVKTFDWYCMCTLLIITPPPPVHCFFPSFLPPILSSLSADSPSIPLCT